MKKPNDENGQFDDIYSTSEDIRLTGERVPVQQDERELFIRRRLHITVSVLQPLCGFQDEGRRSCGSVTPAHIKDTVAHNAAAVVA